MKPDTPAPAATPTTGSGTATSAPIPSPTPGADDPYDDPTESSGKIALTVVMSDKPTFPKASVSEADCWKDVSLSGDHKKDYAAVVARCGVAAGLVEYATPAEGRLHSVKDKVDTFTLKLKGGFCYRYFGVADESINDLDILVQTGSGALVGEDKTTGPVAIIESTTAWCQAEDVDYQFQVQVDGPGKGGYSFGVWARKK